MHDSIEYFSAKIPNTTKQFKKTILEIDNYQNNIGNTTKVFFGITDKETISRIKVKKSIDDFILSMIDDKIIIKDSSLEENLKTFRHILNIFKHIYPEYSTIIDFSEKNIADAFIISRIEYMRGLFLKKGSVTTNG